MTGAINRQAIPDNLKNPNYVLLVQKPVWSKQMVRLTEKYMQDYAGKWEFAVLEDVNSGRYADSTRFRYLLMQNPDVKIVETRGYIPGGNYVSWFERNFWENNTDKTVYADHVFIDRQTKKIYPSTGLRLSDYSWPFKFLIPYLNKL